MSSSDEYPPHATCIL